MPKPIVSTETSSQPLTRFTAQSRRDRLGELRRRSLQATSPRSQPTDTASSPRHPEAPHRVVTPPRRPVHYARPTQQWLDFLAGLLAQTAQAERASAARTESPARP